MRRLSGRERSRAGRGKKNNGFATLVIGGVLIGGGLGWVGPDLVQRFQPRREAVAPVDRLSARFGFCHTGGGTNCVVDGDTIWLGGQKIRVADIDAPETHPPRCSREAELGEAATRRLRQLLNGGAVSLQAIDRDQDRYGRKLRIVLVDGRSVGSRLVDEGLARRYAGGRRPWC